ncbi:unnamed protein product [Sphenostylis stenocarpa]|uniref:Uncharacterized protein n=1 Tax=Sphenostylis stenocarpa TaxID=92480 RepID=A0AA86VA31_9FABA|nr:unnamed protein product [Sphenostylis stenocarpa]
MEVVVAVSPPPPPPPSSSSMEFNFDSNCSSPYITAPSSPQRFGNFFFSAPTSPTRRHSSASTPTTTQDEFEFDFSSHVQRPSLSADELFLGGKIRPLKPSSPSFIPNINKNKISSDRTEDKGSLPPPPQDKRIRERAFSFSTSSASSDRRQSGINSVLYGDDNIDDTSESSPGKNIDKASETVSHSSFLSSISFGKGYRKWRLKDFLLFRSASEGRASDKDPFRKYAVLSKTTAHEDVRNMSFRSAESSGSVSRRRGPVSAHELHYTVNRAASVEMKKKTLLPYKQGLLGCLGFNPGMHHFSARIGSSERS